MRIFLGLILPLLLLLTPVVFQIFFSIMRIRLKTKLTITKILIVSFVFGCFSPIAATYIAMYGFSYGINPHEPNCITGIQLYLFLGFFIALVIIPIIGSISALVQHIKNKKEINISY